MIAFSKSPVGTSLHTMSCLFGWCYSKLCSPNRSSHCSEARDSFENPSGFMVVHTDQKAPSDLVVWMNNFRFGPHCPARPFTSHALPCHHHFTCHCVQNPKPRRSLSRSLKRRKSRPRKRPRVRFIFNVDCIGTFLVCFGEIGRVFRKRFFG